MRNIQECETVTYFKHDKYLTSLGFKFGEDYEVRSFHDGTLAIVLDSIVHLWLHKPNGKRNIYAQNFMPSHATLTLRSKKQLDDGILIEV